MKILPQKEFESLAIEQGFTAPEVMAGFIDKETHEIVVPEGARTRTRTHEVGHEELEHFPKAVKFYSKGRKDVQEITEPWTQRVDDEIEAEMYSYRVMDKKITPRVGLEALRALLQGGWNLYPALSLVIGRLRHYGVEVSLSGRRDLVNIVERARGEDIPWKL